MKKRIAWGNRKWNFLQQIKDKKLQGTTQKH